MEKSLDKDSWSSICKYNREIHDPKLSLARAEFSAANKFYSDAILDYEHYSKFYPADVVQYFNLANCYYSFNNLDKAILNFKKGLALTDEYNKASESVLNNYATLLNLNNQIDEALIIVEEMLKLNPKSANAFLLKGQIFNKKDDLGKAFFYLTKAIEINENFWQAWIIRSTVDYNLGDYEKEIDDYNKAISLNKEVHISYHTTTALALYKLGRKNEAKLQFEFSIGKGDTEAIDFYQKYFG